MAAKTAHILTHPGMIFFSSAGINDQQVIILPEFVHNHVIHERSLGIEQSRILRLSLLKLGNIVHTDPLCRVERLRPSNQYVAHVRNIKHAYGGAHRQMLFHQSTSRWIFNRHVPPAKINHFGANSTVKAVKRSLPQRFGFDGRGQNGFLVRTWYQNSSPTCEEPSRLSSVFCRGQREQEPSLLNLSRAQREIPTGLTIVLRVL